MSEYRTGGFGDFIGDILKAAATSGIKQFSDKPAEKKEDAASAAPLSNPKAGIKVSPPMDTSQPVPVWVWLVLGWIVLKRR